MKEYIKCSIDINGMRGSIEFRKDELLMEFKAAHFYTNNNNNKYFLTIREYIRWKIIQDIYNSRKFKELKKIGL
jgi:hypothetical protein